MEDNNGFVMKVIGIVVALIVTATALVPIVSSATSTQINVPGGENANPVSDLRLAYTEAQDLTLVVEANTYDGLEVTMYFNPDMGGGSPPEPTYTVSGITEDVIIFASDYYTLMYKDGQLIQSVVGEVTSDSDTFIIVMNGQLDNYRLPYTFLYYPSQDGEYANYSAYQFDAGNAFAFGSAYGMGFASKDGEVVGYSSYDVTSTSVTDNGEVVGVDFTVKTGDGTGTLPDDDIGGGGISPGVMG